MADVSEERNVFIFMVEAQEETITSNLLISIVNVVVKRWPTFRRNVMFSSSWWKLSKKP
jgi:hypothetical protein